MDLSDWFTSSPAINTSTCLMFSYSQVSPHQNPTFTPPLNPVLSHHSFHEHYTSLFHLIYSNTKRGIDKTSPTKFTRGSVRLCKKNFITMDTKALASPLVSRCQTVYCIFKPSSSCSELRLLWHSLSRVRVLLNIQQ